MIEPILIIQSVYLMLPAYVANMMPVIVRKLPFLHTPVDFYAKVGKYRLFGEHKTWRGIVFGLAGALLVAFLQYSYMETLEFISLVDYSHWVTLGLLLGCGALVGDLVKSTFKRRFKIKEGKPFIPFDELDFTVGALVFLCFFYVPPLPVFLIILILSPLLHILTNHVAFYLHIRGGKW